MKVKPLEVWNCRKKIVLIYLIATAWNLSCNNSHKSSGANSVTNKLVDERDKQEYEVVTIGEQKWMASNLNFETPNSYCYNNKPNNCKDYGRLYNCNEALEVCPKGWKLPGDEDWKTLEANLGMKEEELNSIRIWRGESEGASMIEQLKVVFPGYGSSKGRKFEGKDVIARYWSKTKGPTGVQFSIYRMLKKGNGKVYSDQIAKMNLCCVRCIQE